MLLVSNKYFVIFCIFFLSVYKLSSYDEEEIEEGRREEKKKENRATAVAHFPRLASFCPAKSSLSQFLLSSVYLM